MQNVVMRLILLDRFHQWPEGVEHQYPCVTLKRDTWNDYGFETLFVATLRPSDDEQSWVGLGGVKFGRRGQKSTEPGLRFSMPSFIDGLDEEWFSLGQSKSYYEELLQQPEDLRRAFAEAMRDIPILRIDVEPLENEDVFRISLLRSSRALEALDFGREIFGEAVALTESFEFRTRIAPAGDHVVQFNFAPSNGLPHRMNVLVGVNGVGKTQLMARLAIALGRFEEEAAAKEREERGESFEEAGTLTPRPSFYGVIAVSFSAFDDFAIPTRNDVSKLDYAYCGIRISGGGLLSEEDLAKRIPQLIKRMDQEQLTLFRAALDLLIPTLAQEVPAGKAFYKGLSAGQRIVLNIVCDLIVNLQRRSLILLDEPETHLHPQLLTTLMTVVNTLLDALDCFAIVATHSPIVVQQVLASQVHVIQRIEGASPIIRNPPSETFGEALSEIVRLVFDSVESDRDYQNVLDDLLAANGGDPDQVVSLFPNGLGLNASLYVDSFRSAD